MPAFSSPYARIVFFLVVVDAEVKNSTRAVFAAQHGDRDIIVTENRISFGETGPDSFGIGIKTADSDVQIFFYRIRRRRLFFQKVGPLLEAHAERKCQGQLLFSREYFPDGRRF